MSWVNILNKNNKEFQVSKNNEVIEIIEEKPSFIDINIKNIDDEFDRKYSLAVSDIKHDFSMYIKDKQLPFLNITNMSGKHLFDDFIKKNSINLKKLSKEVEKENEEYLKEVEEEENEMLEEFYLENN
jgi:hypothetical protein